MAEIKLHANRNLRRRQLPSGERRGLPGYYAFTHQAFPSWWNADCTARYPDALGAYENRRDRPELALVVTPTMVVVLGTDATEQSRVAYADVMDCDSPAKEPLPEELQLRLSGGRTFILPILGRTGAIVDWLRFLSAAASEFSKKD